MKPIQLYDTHDLDALIEVIHTDVIGVCDNDGCDCSSMHYYPDEDYDPEGHPCGPLQRDALDIRGDQAFMPLLTRGCGSAIIRFGFDDESQPMPELQQIDHADYTLIVKRITLWDYLVDDMYNIEMLIEWEGDR